MAIYCFTNSDSAASQYFSGIENVSAEEKSLRIFTNEEGAGAYCQVDNHRLMNEVVITWLNKLWKLNGEN